MESKQDAGETAKEWILDAETEYRFELDSGTTLAIKVRPRGYTSQKYYVLLSTIFELVRGTAEVFGCELAEGKIYVFAYECKAAIFTWHGCTLQMSKIVNIS